MQHSCLQLGFYLSSWGMFRGSSYLLDRSARHFEKIIEYVAEHFCVLNHIDIDKYTDDNIQLLLEAYKAIDDRLIFENNEPTKTLVTKVMLGVFGCVPAYDSLFVQTFGQLFKGRCSFYAFNRSSLECLREFYRYNQVQVDTLSYEFYTLDFDTGKPTRLNYSKAKIVDMYGFGKSKIM